MRRFWNGSGEVGLIGLRGTTAMKYISGGRESAFDVSRFILLPLRRLRDFDEFRRFGTNRGELRARSKRAEWN